MFAKRASIAPIALSILLLAACAKSTSQEQSSDAGLVLDAPSFNDSFTPPPEATPRILRTGSGQIDRGGHVAVSFANFPGNDYQMFRLHQKDSATDVFLAQDPVKGTKGFVYFSVPSSVPSGEYEVRGYQMAWPGSLFPPQLLTRSETFEVRAPAAEGCNASANAAAVFLDSKFYIGGNSIAFRFVGALNQSGQRFGIFHPGAGDNEALSSTYVSGCSGVSTLPIVSAMGPGQYEVRFLRPNGASLAKSALFSYHPSQTASIIVGPSQVVVNAEFHVAYSGTPGQMDQAIVLLKEPSLNLDDVLDYQAAPGAAGNVSFNAPSTPGRYQVWLLRGEGAMVVVRAGYIDVVAQ